MILVSYARMFSASSLKHCDCTHGEFFWSSYSAS